MAKSTQKKKRDLGEVDLFIIEIHDDDTVSYWDMWNHQPTEANRGTLYMGLEEVENVLAAIPRGYDAVVRKVTLETIELP
mgnify:CR=1 FL=1